MSRPFPPAQPHGELSELLPGIFWVTGSMAIGLARFSRNMVVVRCAERLVLVNSIRLDDSGLDQLDRLGRVTDVIRLAGGHGSDDPFYKQRYGATVWAVAGQRYFTGLKPQEGQTYFVPDCWMDAETTLPVPGAQLYRFDTDPPEAVLRLDVAGGTLIAGDSLQNWSTVDPWFNWLGGLMMRAFGFIRPTQLGPGWVKHGQPSAVQLHGLLSFEFENVLPAHGAPVLGAAREAYRPALSS